MLVSQKNIFLIIMIISVISLISAIYIEYILLVPACKLCIYQRIPYLIAILFCFLGYYSSFKKICFVIISLVFLLSTVLSGYHIGIENNIFNEFSGCVSQNMEIIDKNKLLEIIKTQRPSCKDINFSIFGLSLATFNFFISIAITLTTIKYINYEKD